MNRSARVERLLRPIQVGVLIENVGEVIVHPVMLPLLGVESES